MIGNDYFITFASHLLNWVIDINYMDPFINERTKYPLFVSRTLDFYFRKPIVGRNII